ncbi:MAG: glycosyltransferase family 2 protein [Candidatus Moraniibacteriota bacterium]
MLTHGKPDFSLILVNYRSADMLERALLSLQHPDVLDGRMEIIVANNDISEQERIRDLSEYFHFRVVFLPENNGFGNAANQAASVANGNIIGFINPDTELKAGSLDLVLRFFKLHPEVGVVGGSLVSQDGVREAWSTGKPMTLFRLLRNQSALCSGRKYWENKRPISVGWVSGGLLFIRSELFRELLGFDERFFLYFEDMDLCVRAGKNGFRTVFFPNLSFFHTGGASLDSDSVRKRIYYESQDQYFAKHRPRVEGFLVSLFRSGLSKV